MTNEELREIKDSIDIIKEILSAKGFDYELTQEEIELHDEVIRLQQKNWCLKERLEQKDKVIDEAIYHLTESIYYFLSDKEIRENDEKVMDMYTVRDIYLKPILAILKGDNND